MTIGTFFSNRWRWPTVAVILGMIFLARLGVWQLDRLEWRRGINTAKLAEMNAEPLLLNGDLQGLDLTEMINRSVLAVGEYDFENQLIIESQLFQSQTGRYLLTPLILTESDQAILVNRGWIPESETDFSAFDEIGEVELKGRLQKGQTLSGGRTTQVENMRMYRLDVGAAAAVLPYEVLPVFLLPEIDGVIDLELPYLPSADLSLDEGSHFSYALQWFSFAILLAAMYTVYIYRQESKSTH